MPQPNQPVFNKEERVPAPGEGNSTLPPELQGKSAEEVAAYYQKRETLLLEEQKRRAQQPPPQPPQPPPTKKTPTEADFWKDPNAATKTMIQQEAVTQEQFNQLTTQVKSSLIAAARMAAAEQHPDWKEYSTEINEIMNKFDPWARVNQEMWDTAYTFAKGQRYDRDVAAARQSGQQSAERVTLTPPEPPPEIKLNALQLEVARGLELGEARFKKGIERQQSGAMPFTFSNVGNAGGNNE